MSKISEAEEMKGLIEGLAERLDAMVLLVKTQLTAERASELELVNATRVTQIEASQKVLADVAAWRKPLKGGEE